MAPAAVPPPRTPALLARHAALAPRAGRPVTVRAPGRGLRVLAAAAAATAPRPWPAGASLVLADRRVAAPAAAGVGARRLPLGPGLPPGLAAALADPAADAD